MKLFEAVDDVLKGKEKASFDMVSLDNIINDLDYMGFEVDKEIETNGWQVDFWLMCSKDGVDYVVSGSLYYGNFIFSKYQ